jgi:outer membrane usher protein
LGLRWKLVNHVVAVGLFIGAFMSEAADVAHEPQESLLAIEFNQHPASLGSVVLRDPDGTVWLQEAEWKALRLIVPEQPGRTVQGQIYYPLNGVQGVSFLIDEGLQLIKITAAPEALQRNETIRVIQTTAKPSPTTSGGFINYDLFATRDSVINNQGAALELGVFNNLGVVLNTMADRKRVV